jgi:hypothetical protein
VTTRSRQHHIHRGLALAATLASVAWGATALPATADPAGNNGTVKITPVAEDDGIPQNTPHVSCGFDIEWYGFDEGADIVSNVEFTMQAPTSDAGLSATEPAQVFVGEDAAGGGTDHDGEATYTLDFTGAPDPQQGYHVAVTVHTPGSHGADTKRKVFWVEPCDGGPGGSADFLAHEARPRSLSAGRLTGGGLSPGAPRRSPPARRGRGVRCRGPASPRRSTARRRRRSRTSPAG